MAVSKAQKNQILDYLNTSVANQKAVVLITTKDTKTSLDAGKNTEFRKLCRSKGIVVKVCKNTLLQLTFPGISERLTGQTFLACMEDGDKSDEVTVPKAISEALKKDFNDYFNLIGAVVNGEYYDSQMAKKLANIPTKDQSLAMTAGAINQIIAKIAIGIKEIPSSVARGVKAAKSE
jgi:large subunit ribosomal protein L10